MPTRIQAKDLAVEHVGNPCERMPVGGLKCRECPRDSTRLNDYSHLRGFRRVGVERVELLICLNMGLVSSAVNAEHGAGQGQPNTRRDFT